MSQSVLVPTLVLIFVVVRFLMRELRERQLSQTQLFVLPGIFIVVALAFTISVAVAHVARIAELVLECGVAIVVGVAVGFAVSRFTTVRTQSDGRIFFRGSFATVAIWIGALVLRFGARLALAGVSAPAQSATANAALLVLVASALTAVRVLIRQKALSERYRGSTLAETAL